MIRFDEAGLRFYEHSGEWRYWGSGATVHCDHDGCDATARPSGLEHNGAKVESIYGVKGWSLGEQDLCPRHRPRLWLLESRCPGEGWELYSAVETREEVAAHVREHDFDYPAAECRIRHEDDPAPE